MIYFYYINYSDYSIVKKRHYYKASLLFVILFYVGGCYILSLSGLLPFPPAFMPSSLDTKLILPSLISSSLSECIPSYPKAIFIVHVSIFILSFE